MNAYKAEKAAVFSLWCAKTRSRTGMREEIFVMQSTKDRFGADGVRFSATLTRQMMLVAGIDGWGIRNTWTQRRVWTPRIVVRNPGFQNGPQVRFGNAN